MKNKHYKHPAYGWTSANEGIKTPQGRFSWPSLVTPKPGMAQKDGSQGEPRYEVTLLIPKDSPKLASFINELEVIKEELLELYNHKNPAKLGEVQLLKDGDEQNLEKYPYYANCWFLTARNGKESDFQIMGANQEDLTPEEIVGGMKGRLLVTPRITSHGLSFRLDIVQLVGDDGVRFGGGSRDVNRLKDLLGPVEEEEELSQEEGVEETEAETPDEANEEPQASQPTQPTQRFSPAQMRLDIANKAQAQAKAHPMQMKAPVQNKATGKALGPVGKAPAATQTPQMKGKAAALSRL